jgi:hypothetical protein
VRDFVFRKKLNLIRLESGVNEASKNNTAGHTIDKHGLRTDYQQLCSIYRLGRLQE